jgi:IclR family KDG regulon transcriptional repressor
MKIQPNPFKAALAEAPVPDFARFQQGSAPVASLDNVASTPSSETQVHCVRTAVRIMDILKCFSRETPELRLTELSLRVGLSKSTVHRLIKALTSGGFLVTDKSERVYRLGPAVRSLSFTAHEQFDLRATALPHMQEASRSCGVTIFLATREKAEVVYLEKVEPPEMPIRLTAGAGQRRPVHCTGLGKVLLAFGDQQEVESLLRSADLRRFTPSTIDSPAALLEECARIRQQGFAVDNRESNELVVCAAAPIRDASARIVAAISGAAFNISTESARFREIRETIVRTAALISASLG